MDGEALRRLTERKVDRLDREYQACVSATRREPAYENINGRGGTARRDDPALQEALARARQAAAMITSGAEEQRRDGAFSAEDGAGFEGYGYAAIGKSEEPPIDASGEYGSDDEIQSDCDDVNVWTCPCRRGVWRLWRQIKAVAIEYKASRIHLTSAGRPEPISRPRRPTLKL